MMLMMFHLFKPHQTDQMFDPDRILCRRPETGLQPYLVQGLREQRQEVGAGDGAGQPAQRARKARGRVHQHQALHELRRGGGHAQAQAAPERLRDQGDLQTAIPFICSYSYYVSLCMPQHVLLTLHQYYTATLLEQY